MADARLVPQGKFHLATFWARKNALRTGVLFSALCLLAPLAVGQLYTGSVTGVVTDPSGAFVPNAKVMLTDQNKGFIFNGTTGSTGRYLFRSIPPGTYKVSVHAGGFEGETKADVRVDVTQNVSVNFALKIGAPASPSK